MLSHEPRSPLYRDWIKKEYVARKDRNASYSIRAFAKSLGVNKTTLADVLAGKRHFSKALALKVADKLSLTPKQRELFLLEIRSKETQTFLKTLEQSNTDVQFLQLQEDQFKLISDWYYIGILTLAQLREHKADSAWIAAKLGITEQDAKDALAALIRLNLIAVKNRRLVRTSLPLRASSTTPSPAIRRYHRQNLRLAEQSLDSDPVDRRLFGAISLPIHPDDLKKASEMIERFKVALGELSGPKPATEIYTLAIQFFPITKQGASQK